MNPNDNSLMQAIQQYYDMLNGVRQQNLGLGNNQQVQNVQNDVNGNVANLAQRLSNAPVPQVQPWEYDPNNAQAQLAQTLLAKGPEAFVPGTAGSRLLGGVTNTPAATQAGTRDWQRALDNANFWDKSSFYGGGIKSLTPEETQAKQIAAEAAPQMASQGLLAQLKPQAGVDPSQLGFFADLGQKDIASKNLMLGEKYKADTTTNQERDKNKTEIEKANILAKAQTDAANETNKTDIEKANILAKAQTDAAKLEAGKLDTGEINKKQDVVDETSARLASASDAAEKWDDKYFLARQQAQAKLGDAFEKVGVPNDLKPKGYDEFMAKVDDLIKDDVKELAGARGLSNENARNYIMNNLFDSAKDPSTARANFANYITNLHVKDNIAKANLAFARNNGAKLDENSELFKKLNKDKLDSLSPEAFNKARDSVYEAHTKLYPTASPQDLASINDPAALARELKFQQDPKIKSLIQAKIAKLNAGAK